MIERLILAAAEGAAVAEPAGSAGAGRGWAGLLEYRYGGNELWRFGLLLGVIVLTLVAARVVRYAIERTARRLEGKRKVELVGLFLRSLGSAAGAAMVAGGMYAGRWCFKFALEEGASGLSLRTYELWGKLSYAVFACAVAYFLYRSVDVVEHYLRRWASRTETVLDDMLVPVIRKALRVFIVVVAALFIADNILEQDVGTILAAAGIGGLAFALAAKDTLANFFGSITIFADRPFQVGERVKVGDYDGPIEEVGLRSTRIRTLTGHQVSVPNSIIANDMVENIGRRPFIRRLANITITYDTPVEKVERAVQIIKDILSETEEVNRDADLPPRVYFNDFNDMSLNIMVLYWVKPPDYWMFQEINEKVNLAIMRAYEKEGIEFAFPTQTLYLKKGDEGQDG